MKSKKKDREFTNEELVEIAKSRPDFKSPSFQLYISDWLNSENMLTMSHSSIGVYINLLVREWDMKDCGLPIESVLLAKIAGCELEQFISKENEIKKNFFEYEERLYNRRLLQERRKQIERSKKASKAGVMSGKSRKHNKITVVNERSTIVAPKLN